MVKDALERMEAEATEAREQEAKRRQRAAYEGSGVAALDDGFPALEE